MQDFVYDLEAILAKGQKWPPTALQRNDRRRQAPKRLDHLQQNLLLFEGKSDAVYDDWYKVLREDEAALVELAINFPKRLSLLWVSMNFTEPPIITGGNDEATKWLADTFPNLVLDTLPMVGLDMSRYGDGILKPWWNEALGKVELDAQPPYMDGASLFWLPVVSRTNAGRAEAQVLFYTTAETSGILGTVKQYLNVEIHRPGEVETRQYRLTNDGKIGGLIAEGKTVPTGATIPLLIPAHNLSLSDRPWGMDDYGDVDSLVHEIEIRLSQVSRILDKHAEPNLQGPVDYIVGQPMANRSTPSGKPDASLQAQAGVQVGGRYFGRYKEDPEVAYVTWNAQLDAAFKEVEVLLELIYVLSETTPAAFGQLKAGLAESGSALKRLLIAPLWKVSRIRNSLESATKKAIVAAAELATFHGQTVPDLTGLTIEWQDGLPADAKESAEVESALVGAKLTSRKSAVGRLFGLRGKAATDELAEIDAEGKGSEPSPVDKPEVKLPQQTITKQTEFPAEAR